MHKFKVRFALSLKVAPQCFSSPAQLGVAAKLQIVIAAEMPLVTNHAPYVARDGGLKARKHTAIVAACRVAIVIQSTNTFKKPSGIGVFHGNA